MKLYIKEILAKKDLSVYWLQKETGISQPTIYKIANNQTKMITFDNLELLCKALDCTPNDIFGY